MTQKTNKIFDRDLFSKLMEFVSTYRSVFYFVMVAAILLSVFSTLTPYLLMITVDDYITPKDFDGMVLLVGLMLLALCFEVVFQFLFVFYANWLGQHVIQKLRTQLFQKIIGFKMSYFDNSAVGTTCPNR